MLRSGDARWQQCFWFDQPSLDQGHLCENLINWELLRGATEYIVAVGVPQDFVYRTSCMIECLDFVCPKRQRWLALQTTCNYNLMVAVAKRSEDVEFYGNGAIHTNKSWLRLMKLELVDKKAKTNSADMMKLINFSKLKTIKCFRWNLSCSLTISIRYLSRISEMWGKSHIS